MSMGNLALFQGMKQKMDWLAQRHTVLAENVANADTPGYRARDLKPLDFRTMVKEAPRVNMAATTANHLTGIRREPEFRVNEERPRNAYEVSINQNAVSLENQLTNVSQNQADFRLASSLYRQNLTMMKLAIGRQPGA